MRKDVQWIYDETSAQRVVDFIQKLLKHWKGRHRGQKFTLLDWELHATRTLFGWKGQDGFRRYQSMYLEIPKKNGKSAFAAALALALLIVDKEHGAEIYSAAGDRKQARLVHTDGKMMVRQSKPLTHRTEIYQNSILFPRRNSKWEVLSADVPTAHGINPHGIIFDELHVQKRRDLWDTLRLGVINRDQPLTIAITTAGIIDDEALCWTEHNYAKAIIDKQIEDDRHLAIIYGADDKDDWEDPKIWKKANPSLGHTIKESMFANFCKKALQNPAEQESFKRLNLNIWGHASKSAINPKDWDACAGEPQTRLKEPCFMGLDLSSKLDLTAAVLYFPRTHSILAHFWIPEQGIAERKRRDVFDYPKHVASGLITATSGNWIDQEAIRSKINEYGQLFDIQSIGYDPWNASQMATWLHDQDGFRIVEVRQGVRSMTEPSKTMIGMVKNHRLLHGGNPVLGWCAKNLKFRTDTNDNWVPKKGQQTKRIDGMVALIMAIGQSLLSADKPAPWVFVADGAA